jgi:hypothetical protein
MPVLGVTQVSIYVQVMAYLVGALSPPAVMEYDPNIDVCGLAAREVGCG